MMEVEKLSAPNEFVFFNSRTILIISLSFTSYRKIVFSVKLGRLVSCLVVRKELLFKISLGRLTK